ncbi:putative E3 ubiquitin-protein ligase [Podospora australis]|uniref:HECT-type E3 ubiquitin transferase n=1 Tax=Podospora australis TaxID=1536484 RepID=A0AAN7AKK8_9PEZI|nr:putative E3 ubiquitin-protein ligase [Podospora australis]
MAPWPGHYNYRVGSHRPNDPAIENSSTHQQQYLSVNAHLRPRTGSTSQNGHSNDTVGNGQGDGGNSGGGGGRYRSKSRVGNEFDVIDGLQQLQLVETSSSDEGLHPHRPSRPRHTRSMSHPFPSLFSSNKKKKPEPMPRGGGTGGGGDDDDSGLESGADIGGPLPKIRGRQPPPSNRGHRNGSSAGSRDYTTGNCMTCGSLVRWPRDLHVFKCTICLTINDLQPTGHGHDRDQSTRREDTQRQAGGASPEKRAPARSPGRRDLDDPWLGKCDMLTSSSVVDPVSLEHTQSLVLQCLQSFLESALRQHTAATPDFRPETSDNNPFFSPHKEACSTPSYEASSFTLQLPNPSPSGARPVPISPGNRNQHRPNWANTGPKSLSNSYSDKRSGLSESVPEPPHHKPPQPPSPGAEARRIFRSLDDYIIDCFTSFHCLNSSFTYQRSFPPRSAAEDERRRPSVPNIEEPRREQQNLNINHPIVNLDAKLLLLGNFAENGSWWTGSQEETVPGRSSSSRSQNGYSTVSPRNPRIEWAEMEEWYSTVIETARSWPDVYSSLVDEDPDLVVSPAALMEIETQILMAQENTQRILLKACETILKRPGRPLVSPHDLRFILIVAANPLLHGHCKPYSGEFEHPGSPGSLQSNVHLRGSGPASGRHSGIIKRIVGLMSNASSDCQNHLIAWFARYPEPSFVQLKDLVSGFLAYRLIRQNEKKYETRIDITDGLIPSMGAGRSPASLHAALGHTPGTNKKRKDRPKKVIYQDDWQIKAAAQVLGFLFAANNMSHVRQTMPNHSDSTAGGRGKLRGQVFATSDFYTTLLDDSDLVADFEAWEKKQARFAFCQYPFLLSIGAKIQILEHDAKRQMENKARDAFFDSILTHRVVQQFLTLNIRRECLVDDSLKAVSEAIGAGGEDLKKGLKITFKGEEGVDAGGLRKEWFLLLVREVFNPDHGMFLYDEDSQYCYFNPNSLEPSEQFFLVGVVFGLAIYNSTILDVALPPFAFRKLLMAAPPPSVATSVARQSMTYTLDDLAEYRPRLAHGLRQLLEYEGDVESTFCLDFVVDTDKYGLVEKSPLCPGGERRPVTNSNRREYVDAYVRHVLDTGVTRQFEPFKRGFFTVCGGNALSLFRPEEIELLVRGSDEALDIDSLKAVAQYDNWDSKNPGEDEPLIQWFWNSFERASPQDQRKLLLFITGSDRIPAMGAASLVIKISCLGDDIGRYPTARTCFNALSLWKYRTRERLEEMLWGAVNGSEGFGLK